MIPFLKKFLFLIIIAFLVLFGLFFLIPNKKDENLPETKPLPTLTIEPTEKHSKTIIFLHGLGNSANNHKQNLRPLARNHPHIKFIFPQASVAFVSMNKNFPMYSWYNIKGNLKDIMNLKQDKEGLLKSVEQIKQIIQSEIDSGIEPKNILVAGFSQGASVALALGLTSDYQLAGITCIAGFLPCREEIFSWAKEESKNIPFTFYHSHYDDMVPYKVGQGSAKLIEEQGYSVEFKTLSEVGGHVPPSWKFQEVIKKEIDNLLKN